MAADVRDDRAVFDLRRHIPRIVLEWDEQAPGSQHQQVDASLVFADVSGFTALTERLAVRGRMGAEELIETLNRVFGAMLAQAAIRGGEMLKFGGDALLFVFRGEGHAMRACRSAVDMRQALREAAKIPTSVGKLKLAMSVGISSGPVDFFLVGSPTRELLILGPAGTQTAAAEKAAEAGQILVTESTSRQLPNRSTEPRPDGLHRLRWRFTYPPEGEGPPTPPASEELLRTVFPHALGEYLAAAVPEPEHKTATIGFVRFSGTDALLRTDGPAAVAAALHGTISVLQEEMIAEGVTLLATDLDSDGGKLFMAAGVPKSSEDDEGRMLRAMRRALDRGTPLPLQVGVNRGHVFAAEVGYINRAAYSAMGDTTNTAARIMSKAPLNTLFAHPSVIEHSRTLFATTPSGPYEMKGKAVPVPVLDVGEELGTREVQSRGALPLIGRDDELAQLREGLATGLAGAGRVIVVSAATGLGKSRLINEGLKDYTGPVVKVRAEPYGATAPYRMLRDPVRNAFGVQRGAPDEMAATLLDSFRRLMPDLLPYAPLLQDVVNIPLPSTPEASAIEPRFRPARIAEIIVRLVEATVPAELVVIVEEAHWADASSITVLDRIAGAAAGKPWVVLVARRVDGDGFAPAADDDIVLEALTEDDIRRIVIEATQDSPLRPHELDGIVARAAGNPLFVEEIIRVYRETGTLEAVPDNLHAALDAQIDALDPYSRQILRYASVLGRSFRREVLDEFLAVDGLVFTDATLQNLQGFLESEGAGRLRFRTGMIRDAAYEGLAFRLRKELHTAAGRAIEKLSTDVEADADTLSLHYWQGGDNERTWRFARLAGERAAHAFANIDAAVQFERALEASKGLADVTDEDRLALWMRVAAVREPAGLWDEGLKALGRAAKLARGDRLATASVILQRATLRWKAGHYVPALRDISRGLQLLADDTSHPAQLSAIRLESQRVAVRTAQGQFKWVVQESSRLMGKAREVGDPASLAAALISYSLCSMKTGDLTVGPYLQEALEVTRASHDLGRAYRAYATLALLEMHAGRWAGAADAFYGTRTTALSAGDSLGAAQSSLNLGELLIQLGRLDEAQEVLDDSMRVLRAARDDEWIAFGELTTGRLLIARGDYVAAMEMLTAAKERSEAIGDDETVVDALLVHAEALTLSGDPERALVLISEANSYEADDVNFIPRSSREMARAHFALGNVAEARTHVAEGLARAREFERPYEELRLLHVAIDVAEHVADSGAADEARAAAAKIEADLGMGREPALQ